MSPKIGKVDWSKAEFVDENKFSKSNKFLKEGDILIQSVAHSKDYIGDKIALVENIPKNYKKVLALSKFLVVRPDKNKISPEYLFTYLSSDFGRKQLKHFIRGMTAEVYEFDIKNLVIIRSPKEKEIGLTLKKNIDEYEKLAKEIKDTRDQLDSLI